MMIQHSFLFEQNLFLKILKFLLLITRGLEIMQRILFKYVKLSMFAPTNKLLFLCYYRNGYVFLMYKTVSCSTLPRYAIARLTSPKK